MPRLGFADTGVPVIPYDSVPNPVHLPADMYFGECSGVAVNSKGHVFVFSRGNTTGPAYAAAAAQLLEFGPDGNFIREIGHNLYAWSFAHTVKVDQHDNIWVTDKGSDMVIKFTPDGRVDMVFGRKQEASDEDTGPLEASEPAAAGRATGRSARSPTWPGTPPATPTSATATSIRASPRSTRTATGSSPGATAATGPASSTRRTASRPTRKGNVYVADRGNRRIQVFDSDGNFLRQFTIDVPVRPTRGRRSATCRTRPTIAGGTFAPGAPWAICITPGPNQVLYSADAYPGRIYKLIARRQGPGRARPVRQAAEAVRLDPRDRLPVGERALRRRALELARTEARAARLAA